MLEKGQRKVQVSHTQQIYFRSLFIHVAIPGQEPGAPDLSDDFHFPKIKVCSDFVKLLSW